MIKKHSTNCCALCQLSIPDEASQKEIKDAVDFLKMEAKKQDWHGTPNDAGGQRAVFVITTPTEKNLRKNLRELGFTISRVFNRRKGYPEGVLTMWMLNF